MPEATPAAAQPTATPSAASATPPTGGTPPAGAAPAAPVTALGAAAETPPAAAPPKADAGNPAETPPAEYTLKFPEGFNGDKMTVDGFTNFAKEAKIPIDVAQKFVDSYIARYNEQVKESQDKWFEQVTKWGEEAKADKEFGGEKFKQSVETGQRVLRTFGSPELVGLLNSTGLGNHKSVISLFAKIGAAISEDKLPRDLPGHAGADDQQAVLDAMYPSMVKK